MNKDLPRCLQVYDVLRKASVPMTRCELAALTGNHEATVYAWLAALRDCGLVREAGTRHTGKRGLDPVLFIAERK